MPVVVVTAPVAVVGERGDVFSVVVLTGLEVEVEVVDDAEGDGLEQDEKINAAVPTTPIRTTGRLFGRQRATSEA